MEATADRQSVDVQETPAKMAPAKVDSLKERVQALEEERKELATLVKSLQEMLVAQGILDANTRCEVETVHDPFEDNNPFNITGSIPANEEFPEGQVLRWLAPSYRERKGMRGWVYMCWGDPYTGPSDGTKLREYGISDPPAEIAASQKTGTQVVRNGMILGRLDKQIWNARRRKAELRAERNRMSSGSFTTRIPRGGGELGIGSKGDSGNRRPVFRNFGGESIGRTPVPQRRTD
jgi:hypothetical protein